MTEGSSVVEAVALSGGVRDSPRASWPGATDLQDEASGGPGNGPGEGRRGTSWPIKTSRASYN